MMIILYVPAPLGTGEGEVEEAERLLKPFRLHYPQVRVNKDRLFKL